MASNRGPRDRRPEDIVREGLSAVGGVPDDGPRYVDEDTESAPVTQSQSQSPVAGPNPGLPTPAPVADNTAANLLSNTDLVAALVDALRNIATGQQDARVAAQQALEMSAKMQQPDNRTAPGRSVYNPQGDAQYPRPRLKCKMFIPWPADPESLTFEEIELLNLLEPGEYFVRRNDGTRITVTIRASHNLNGSMDRLLLNAETAFNNDNHWLMPPLATLLREVLKQVPAARDKAGNVLTMDDREYLVSRGELPISVGVR